MRSVAFAMVIVVLAVVASSASYLLVDHYRRPDYGITIGMDRKQVIACMKRAPDVKRGEWRPDGYYRYAWLDEGVSIKFCDDQVDQVIYRPTMLEKLQRWIWISIHGEVRE